MYQYKKRIHENCLKCGKKLSGRSDSKYCCDDCRLYVANNKPQAIINRKANSAKWLKNIRYNHPEKFFYLRLKWYCKRKNIPFNLDESDIIIPKKCPLIGVDLFLTDKKATINTPSIDRINPKLGYIKGNVWIISNKANTMKQDVDIDTLKKFCSNVLSIL